AGLLGRAPEPPDAGARAVPPSRRPGDVLRPLAPEPRGAGRRHARGADELCGLPAGRRSLRHPRGPAHRSGGGARVPAASDRGRTVLTGPGPEGATPRRDPPDPPVGGCHSPLRRPPSPGLARRTRSEEPRAGVSLSVEWTGRGR